MQLDEHGVRAVGLVAHHVDLAIEQAVEVGDGVALLEDVLALVVHVLHRVRHHSHEVAVRDTPTLPVVARRPGHPLLRMGAAAVGGVAAAPKAAEDALHVARRDVALAVRVKRAVHLGHQIGVDHARRLARRVHLPEGLPAARLPAAGLRGLLGALRGAVEAEPARGLLLEHHRERSGAQLRRLQPELRQLLVARLLLVQRVDPALADPGMLEQRLYLDATRRIGAQEQGDDAPRLGRRRLVHAVVERLDVLVEAAPTLGVREHASPDGGLVRVAIGIERMVTGQHDEGDDSRRPQVPRQ